MTENAPTAGWLTRRRYGAARALRRAVSATHLTHRRPGFGWTVRPAAGSILASPESAHWDPEPDYFHHWVRDAAIALRAVPLAMAADSGSAGFWRQAVADHVDFSLSISDPARRGPAVNPLSETTRVDHRRFLRPDAELAALGGADWLAEPRFAADGGPDLERWSRPQHDGPALRAAVLMDLCRQMPGMGGDAADMLVRRDLAHAADTAGAAGIGPWEEEPARRSTFTLIVQWDALDRGAGWLSARGTDAPGLRMAAERVGGLLDQVVDPATGAWRESVEAPAGAYDSAAVLGLLHADRMEGRFALTSPGTAATVAALEDVFAALYPINRGRTVPAMGRWADDRFFGGNPWYPVTLGFAELHYLIAARCGSHDAFAKAEAWMVLIEEVAPDGDDLPEQFHRITGAPVSCRALTWSAAAFLGAAAARDAARQAMG